MARDWRIFVFADPRKMGESAYDCYRGWHQQPRSSKIIWVGNHKTEKDAVLRCNGKASDSIRTSTTRPAQRWTGKDGSCSPEPTPWG